MMGAFIFSVNIMHLWCIILHNFAFFSNDPKLIVTQQNEYCLCSGTKFIVFCYLIFTNVSVELMIKIDRNLENEVRGQWTKNINSPVARKNVCKYDTNGYF